MGSWDLLTRVVLRLVPGTFALLVFCRLVGRYIKVDANSLIKGLSVGGVGFGLGTILLLYGQEQLDPLTPAVAAAMIPVAGVLLEVFFDKKRTSRTFVFGLLCAVIGGLIAAEFGLNEYEVNIGFIWCLTAVCLYARATRETNSCLSKLSSLKQTVKTPIGASMFVSITLIFAVINFLEQQQYGSFDTKTLIVLFAFSLLFVSISQPSWIAGARGLGIAVASFHLNAVPFYIMVVLVFMGDGTFDPFKLRGVFLIGLGIF